MNSGKKRSSRNSIETTTVPEFKKKKNQKLKDKILRNIQLGPDARYYRLTVRNYYNTEFIKNIIKIDHIYNLNKIQNIIYLIYLMNIFVTLFENPKFIINFYINIELMSFYYLM